MRGFICVVLSKSASQDLYHSLALLARRLYTSNVNPDGLSPPLVCRLIALDKCPGVRPIGICNTARRILAKPSYLYSEMTFRRQMALNSCAQDKLLV